MIRTGAEYRESIRDGREVWMNGERVTDVTTHPAFKPLVDARVVPPIASPQATEDPVAMASARCVGRSGVDGFEVLRDGGVTTEGDA